MAENRQQFGITGDWSTAALDQGVCSAQYAKGAVDIWPRGGEDERASENRQWKREAEEADKVTVTPEATVASLRRCFDGSALGSRVRWS